MKEINNTSKGYSPVFAYFVPSLNKIIKAEKVNINAFVADIGNGLERIPKWQMKAEKWKCIGKWELINENV